MLPVRVILPRETLSPLEGSDGTSPTEDMDDRASGKREKSPISAAMEKAVTAGIPLAHLSAEAAGAMSSPAARSSMAPPGLARLSPGGLTLSRHSPETSRSQGSANPGLPSHSLWAFVHAVFPGYTIPFLSRNSGSRCLARIRSWRQSSRARARSRAASIASVGMATPAMAAHGEHARQEGGVAPAGPRPVARGPEHLGDGADHAWDACLAGLPLQAEARGAGPAGASCGLGHALGPFGDLARAMREGLLDYLPGLRDECRGGDGARVYVEPDAGTIEHGWDLLRNVASRSDNRSLTHDAPQRALVS